MSDSDKPKHPSEEPSGDEKPIEPQTKPLEHQPASEPRRAGSLQDFVAWANQRELSRLELVSPDGRRANLLEPEKSQQPALPGGETPPAKSLPNPAEPPSSREPDEKPPVSAIPVESFEELGKLLRKLGRKAVNVRLVPKKGLPPEEPQSQPPQPMKGSEGGPAMHGKPKVDVHVLDQIHGYVVVRMEVGTHISEEEYRKFVRDNKVCAIVAYQAGQAHWTWSYPDIWDLFAESWVEAELVDPEALSQRFEAGLDDLFLHQRKSAWYYARGGQRSGPVSIQDLRRLVQSGQLQPTDLLWKEGMTGWVPASRLNVVFPPAAYWDYGMAGTSPVPQPGPERPSGETPPAEPLPRPEERFMQTRPSEKSPEGRRIMSEWYYAERPRIISGPVSREHLRGLLQSGHLQPTDPVWQQGMDGWAPANRVTALLSVASGGGAQQAEPPVLQPGSAEPLHRLKIREMALEFKARPFGLLVLSYVDALSPDETCESILFNKAKLPEKTQLTNLTWVEQMLKLGKNRRFWRQSAGEAMLQIRARARDHLNTLGISPTDEHLGAMYQLVVFNFVESIRENPGPAMFVERTVAGGRGCLVFLVAISLAGTAFALALL